MGIFKDTISPDRRRCQLIFHNDNTFEFRDLDIQDNSLIVKAADAVKQAWPVLNKLTLPFAGLNHIKRTRVLMCTDNDIIWDPFNRLSDDEKPEKGPDLIKDWITGKADAVRYRFQSKPPESSMMNKVIWFAGSGMVCVVLGYLLVLGTN